MNSTGKFTALFNLQFIAMQQYSENGMDTELADFETPFADVAVLREDEEKEALHQFEMDELSELESPFARTFDLSENESDLSPAAEQYVELLGELNDSEFTNMLYELAAEAEESWTSKISNETAMGDKFIPFAMQQGNEHFAPLIVETENMIDRISEHFSSQAFSDQSDAELERFFTDFEVPAAGFSPPQEFFFKSIFKKVKSAVNKGISLAKKGIKAIGKVLPIKVILKKLKGLIRPLLNRVLRYAIGKLPQALQPHARSLSKKFLKMEVVDEAEVEEGYMAATGDLASLQSELDNQVASMVFSGDENEMDELIMNYESFSSEAGNPDYEESGGLNLPSLEEGRQQFIDDLKNLKEGESPAPAIERFLPVAIMALRPAIKIALKIIGRQKVINFLAGLLAKLVGRYVPEKIARPLAASIINVGLSAIGFETYEQDRTEVAYEAIANTIQDTIQNIGELNEENLEDHEALAAQLLEAFEPAAANNFPAEYIKEEARVTKQRGLWILKPRSGPRHSYKKYSHIFDTTITPAVARRLTTFKGTPLQSFLRDKMGLDTGKPVRARVHLYEAIKGTRLTQISRYEKVPGLGTAHAHGGRLFHPLTAEAASLLCGEPGLGRNFSRKFSGRCHRIAVGQRFYFLEINGARFRLAQSVTGNKTSSSLAASSDVQAIVNFVRSEIVFRYFFSEEEAKMLVEKMNKNDFTGAAITIRQSVRSLLNGVLMNNIGDRVKIIHEAMPELFLENLTGDAEEEQFSPFDVLRKVTKTISLSPAKALLTSLVSKLVNKFATKAYESISAFFKTRGKEFKQAQAEVQDGVTLELKWKNVPGMSSLRTVIKAVKGNMQFGNLTDLSMPSVESPDLKIMAGKKFE